MLTMNTARRRFQDGHHRCVPVPAERGSFVKTTAFVCLLVSVACLLVSVAASAAHGERTLLGGVSHIVPSSIRVGPDGKRFAAVTVNPQTKERRVVVNCEALPGAYDAVAEGTPIFSPDGKRFAFVASRRGKCFVVVDGTEGRNYEITGDRWPIADLVFSPTGRHLAYKTRKEGKNYLVVDGKELGPYEDAAAEQGGKVRGIWDFWFAGDDNYFSYRAKTGEGMVACRGRFQDEKISLTTSRAYETIGLDTPVWLRGKSGKQGHLFAFIARQHGKEFVGLLPKPEKKDNKDDKPKTYDVIRRGSLGCAPNRTLGFVARDGNRWKAVVGGKEWWPCDKIGRLMYSPSGNRWACDAEINGNVVMLVNGEAGSEYDGIRYPGSVFAARDARVVYAAAKEGHSLVVLDGKEGEPYPEVYADSIRFGPHRRRMAYTAGDGEKQFVILDGWKGPAFDRVSNLRFSPAGDRFAYRARNGLKHYVVVDGKPVGPYEDVAPGSPVFSPDGLAVAWAAMGEDGHWRVYVDGNAGPPCDAIVSRLTFGPRGHEPVYVARRLSEGKHAFALVSRAGVGREYTSIWMGDGGRLFVRNDGRVDYFGKKGPLVYKVTDRGTRPQLFLSDVEYEKATDGMKDRPAYDRRIDGHPLKVGGIEYAKGIGVCAPSEITYDLETIRETLGGSDPLRFAAVVGLDDERSHSGTVRCSVYADDAKLASTLLLRRDRRHRFEVPIPSDAGTLRLVTADGGDGKDHDWCDWLKAGIEAGAGEPSPWPGVVLPAQWARLEGEGIKLSHWRIDHWNEKAQAWWEFICPADGTYEVFISYRASKEEAGGELAVDIGEQTLRGKVQNTGDWYPFKRFSVGQVSLNKGKTHHVTLRVTKEAAKVLEYVRCLALVQKKE